MAVANDSNDMNNEQNPKSKNSESVDKTLASKKQQTEEFDKIFDAIDIDEKKEASLNIDDIEIPNIDNQQKEDAKAKKTETVEEKTTEETPPKKRTRRRKPKKIITEPKKKATENKEQTNNTGQSENKTKMKQSDTKRKAPESIKESSKSSPKPNVNIKHSTSMIDEIGDIGAYMEAQKKKKATEKISQGTDDNQEKTKINSRKTMPALEGSNGEKLIKTPGSFAVVPHARGDHKLVYLKKDAPKDLRADDKGRKAGSTYIKKGVSIYDVHADFHRHPTLKSKDGQHMDVWIVEDEAALDAQLAAIQNGKGGGTNFGLPILTKQQSEKEETQQEGKKIEKQLKNTKETSEKQEPQTELDNSRKKNEEKKDEVKADKKNEKTSLSTEDDEKIKQKKRLEDHRLQADREKEEIRAQTAAREIEVKEKELEKEKLEKIKKEQAEQKKRENKKKIKEKAEKEAEEHRKKEEEKQKIIEQEKNTEKNRLLEEKKKKENKKSEGEVQEKEEKESETIDIETIDISSLVLDSKKTSPSKFGRKEGGETQIEDKNYKKAPKENGNILETANNNIDTKKIDIPEINTNKNPVIDISDIDLSIDESLPNVTFQKEVIPTKSSQPKKSQNKESSLSSPLEINIDDITADMDPVEKNIPPTSTPRPDPIIHTSTPTENIPKKNTDDLSIDISAFTNLGEGTPKNLEDKSVDPLKNTDTGLELPKVSEKLPPTIREKEPENSTARKSTANTIAENTSNPAIDQLSSTLMEEDDDEEKSGLSEGKKRLIVNIIKLIGVIFLAGLALIIYKIATSTGGNSTTPPTEIEQPLEIDAGGDTDGDNGEAEPSEEELAAEKEAQDKYKQELIDKLGSQKRQSRSLLNKAKLIENFDAIRLALATYNKSNDALLEIQDAPETFTGEDVEAITNRIGLYIDTLETKLR